MKLFFFILFFSHILVMMAQDTTKLFKLNNLPIQNIEIIEEKTINKESELLREELKEDSFCQQKVIEYRLFCAETDCKFTEAKAEVDRLNIENEDKGCFYEIEYTRNYTFNWEGCDKYSNLYIWTEDCYDIEINFVRKEKSKIILDGSFTGEKFYEEDIKVNPR